MTKEKMAYYGKMANKDFNALFVSQTLTVKEGITPKLSKKALYINALVAERGEMSLRELNALYANSNKLDKKGYFTSADIITFNDLANIQRASLLGAKCADNPDALRLLNADKKPCFLEVHRDKKTGSLSVARVEFDDCLCDIKVISKAEIDAKKEKKEREMLEKLLKKYGK